MLRIILEPLGLTYVIEDEVMKITTSLAAEEKLSVRVYPVGDLVIPIITPMAGGLGQGLGGTGGFGGQGGMGGGQFGMGGMGGGMGGMGMGGGFYSLPAETVPTRSSGQRSAVSGQPESRAVPARPFFAQVKDEPASRGLNNAAVEALKKKR